MNAKLCAIVSIRGALVVPPDESPFAADSFRRLQELAPRLPYERHRTEIPDGAVRCSRIVLMKNNRRVCRDALSSEFLRIIRCRPLDALFSKVFGLRNVTVLRSQALCMREGDYIDRHRHRDARFTAVLSISPAESGGQHFFCMGSGETQIMELPSRAMILSSAQNEHGVRRIERGQRLSLVWLLT